MKKILKYLIILGLLQANANASSEPPTTHSVHLNSTVSLDMIWCPPGTFTMGSPSSETGRGTDENQHQVTLTNGFYLGKFEVTQTQYETVMTGNSEGLNAKPSHWPNNNDRPVEKVSWNDVQVFLSRLNDMEQTAGRLPAGWKYVLPSEAQWEYACRAGTTTAYSWGNDFNSSRANYNWHGSWNTGDDFKQTRDVGQYTANPWGFFDMQGNVWEWVHDWKANYLTGAQTDPEGPASGSIRVLRGGSWDGDGTRLRSARRDHGTPGFRNPNIGFRVGFQKVTDEKSAPEPPTNTLKDGLIGHWTFDETEGSIAHDASGNENHGQLHNGPTWTKGKFGGALSFDGVNDRVKLPAEMLKDLVNLTFSFWFLESQQPQDFHTFISAANNVTHNHIFFRARKTGHIEYFDQLKPKKSNGKMLFSYDYGKGASSWTKIALVRDNSSSNLFIDGDLHKSHSRENHRLDVAPNGLWIGGDQDRIGSSWDHDQQLNGKLDDYRIYNRALSANEIKELYKLGNKSTKPAPDATPPETGPGDAPDLKCKETIAKLEAEIKNQKVEITDLNILVIELRKQVADLNSSNIALTTEVSGLKNQVNNLNGQVTSLTSENGELKGQVTNLREDNGNLQLNVTSLNEQLIESDRIAKTPFVHGWIYTPDHGWLHINPDNFPIIYKNDTQTWHYYEQGSINPRYFYNFNEQKWEAWDSENK